MSQELQLRTPDPLPDPGFTSAPAEPPPPNPLVLIHRLLRGRYHWCVLLGLLGLGLGGFGGFKSAQPIYSSTGLIDVKPYLAPIITPTPETGMMPAFASFVEAQVSLIRSQRVIDKVFESEAWRKFDWPYDNEGIAAFMKALNVRVPSRGGQLVLVSFEDPDPAVAQTAVRLVLAAYQEIYVDAEIQADRRKRDTLEQRRSQLTAELRRKRESIQQAAAELGTDDLRPVHDSKLRELLQVEASLASVNAALVELEGKQADPAANATQPAGALTLEEIAFRDPGMRQALREIADLQFTLEVKLASMGENHPEKQKTRALLDARRRQAEVHAETYRRLAAAAPAPLGANLELASLEQLRASQKRYGEMAAAARAEVIRIGRLMVEIDRARAEAADISQRLDETNRRLDLLSVEAPIQERIQIRSTGDRALVAKDKRKQMAAVGGFGGGCLGIGLVALLGLMDRRMRSPDDARPGGARLALLGVLPTLPDDLSDPEQAAIASHCVHQIRTLLQIRTAGHGNRVFAVTSPSAGSGKTSLTLGLGVSFASSGARTLIIDCDVVGGGLTQRVDAIVHRKIGRILRDQGLLTTPQLETALRLSRASQRRLGEVLVELGYLQADDLLRALSVQEQTPVGLLEALAGEDINDCIAETGIQGLFILPLGRAHPSDMSRVAPEAMRRLLRQALERFDAILIDTGPVPGSVEASALVSVVDAMVMVVSRGESRPMAERSINYLRDIGATIAGLVFNRAHSDDMEFAATTSRMSVREGPAAGEGRMEGLLCPIATAVRGRASGGSASANGNGNGNGHGNGSGA